MSSPRQKMVVLASPQPNELEQKKKRQTLERAKANHLSKQLQMRLQYAKLKVEYGWQRQNLNEVENLYFHHSHLRGIRQGVGQRHHYATVTYPPPSAPSNALLPAETHVVQSPPPSGMPDRTMGPSPSANDASSSGSVSSPSQSPSEHAPTADGRPSSQPPSQSQSHPAIQTPVPAAPLSTPTPTNYPPSTLDLSDPNILARLAQLQAQVQMPSQSQAQTLSRQPSMTIPPPTSISASTSQPVVPVPIPASPGTFPLHVQLSQPSMSHPQPGFAFPVYAPQSLFGALPPGSVPIYPVPAAHPASTSHNPAAPSQPPAPVSTAASASTSAPTAPIPTTPTPAPIASTALTYDSFWSTHASSTGSTRALYRTHTGFTASATPGGNVAMLTPGGHAAIMTAEGVYVGGASNRSG